MTRQDPVGEIRSSAEQVKYVAVVCSVRLWDFVPDGYLWVCPSWGIDNLPRSGNINTTIEAPNREVVPFNVSQFCRLLEVDGGWLKSGVRILCNVRPERV